MSKLSELYRENWWRLDNELKEAVANLLDAVEKDRKLADVVPEDNADIVRLNRLRCDSKARIDESLQKLKEVLG